MQFNVDNKTFAIGMLSLSAVVLFVAGLNHSPQVTAAESVRGRDYQAVTAKSQQGDDALYLVDGKTGLMAVFSYNPARRSLEAKAVKPVTDAFGGAMPAGGNVKNGKRP